MPDRRTRRLREPGSERPLPPELTQADEAIGDLASAPRGVPANRAAERRLETILRSLPARELDALAERVGVEVDPRKRLDKPAQLARALVRLPDVREPGRLPAASIELLRRAVEAGGALVVGAVPQGLEPLVRRGLLFARMADEELADAHRREHGGKAGSHVLELVLPTAFLVQIKAGEGEDPRSIRALLADAPFETASAIASQYLGRPSTPPVALSLEPAWEVLGDPNCLAAELSRVSHQERRLLDQLEQLGGEVDTQELMDLEREPMRVRGVYGVAAGRRGAAFSLEKRGFLFPVHPGRYVLPTEVAALVGADRRAEREQRRERIRAAVVEDDLLPRRARFSLDPAPFALGLALAAREAAVTAEVKSGVGTPRSLLGRLAQRFGRSPEDTALVVALSRATGLWEPTASSTVARPGSLRLGELARALFEAWRRGGAWDEARTEAELLRLPVDARDPSPVGVLREVVLEALADLGEDRWVPYRSIAEYVEVDPRMGGLRRLLGRWARRAALPVPSDADLVRRVLLESLPALGAVDVGGLEGDGGGDDGVALRLTARGREFLRDASEGPRAVRPGESEFVEERRLRIGGAARVGEVLELASFVEVLATEGSLEVETSAAALGRGLALGLEAGEMRRRLEVFATLPPSLVGLLEEVGTVLGTATFTPAAGFLWVDDVEVRELLRTRAGVADSFIDPSPEGGLLVVPGVDPERLARRCRALGVEVTLEEAVLRARRSTIPPPGGSDKGRRAVSWRPPPQSGAPPSD